MIDEEFLNAHDSAFEDFWQRRVGGLEYTSHYPAYGYEVQLKTNQKIVLDAAHISAPRYCRAKPLVGAPVIEIRVVVVPTLPATPLPENLPAMLQTVGVGDTLFQAATPWVQWFTDVMARTCTMVISPALAADPWLLSRSFLDRATNNILVREGVGQLHSTTLVRDDAALLFVAPHGTGKSTTAFHLLNAGFRLMGDGLLFVREKNGAAATQASDFELLGYPVGEAKLTTEAQPLFPEWRGEGIEVTAHNVVKHVVNLRALAPHKMIETSVFPKRIVMCLAERNGQPTTTVETLDSETALARLLPDTIFWDEPKPMQQSLNVLKHLIEHSACYRLTLGADRQQLVETIVGLVQK
jgi:hypothetical protein